MMKLTTDEAIKQMHIDYPQCIEDKTLTLSQAKGIAYDIAPLKDGNFLMTATYSTVKLYKVFSPKEVQIEKIRQITEFAEYEKGKHTRGSLIFEVFLPDDFLKTYNSYSSMIKKIDTFFSIWKSKGLIYTVDYVNKTIRFDVSSNLFTPNYLWASLPQIGKLY